MGGYCYTVPVLKPQVALHTVLLRSMQYVLIQGVLFEYSVHVLKRKYRPFEIVSSTLFCRDLAFKMISCTSAKGVSIKPYKHHTLSISWAHRHSTRSRQL